MAARSRTWTRRISSYPTTAFRKPITNFGTGEAPMTICMLIEFANRWWPYLVIALRYSYDFLNVIHPKDWVAVVVL